MKNIINTKEIKKQAPKMAGALVGGVAAGSIKKGLTKVIPAQYQNDMAMNGAMLLIGVIAASQKNDMVSGAGYGILGTAGQGFGAQFGLGDPYFLGSAAPEYIEIDGLEEMQTNADTTYLGDYAYGGELSY